MRSRYRERFNLEGRGREGRGLDGRRGFRGFGDYYLGYNANWPYLDDYEYDMFGGSPYIFEGMNAPQAGMSGFVIAAIVLTSLIGLFIIGFIIWAIVNAVRSKSVSVPTVSAPTAPTASAPTAPTAPTASAPTPLSGIPGNTPCNVYESPLVCGTI